MTIKCKNEKCNKVSETEDAKFCMYCGTKLSSFIPFNSTYGLWEVTTENDCEGKTTKDLGVYEGHIDDIVAFLKEKQYYSLNVKNIEPKKIKTPTTTTMISVSTDSTISLSVSEKVEFWRNFLRNRLNVTSVLPGNHYNSVIIQYK